MDRGVAQSGGYLGDVGEHASPRKTRGDLGGGERVHVPGEEGRGPGGAEGERHDRALVLAQDASLVAQGLAAQHHITDRAGLLQPMYLTFEFSSGFTLRQLREGGCPWNELVIFLRCTHAELVDAGFEGIDPKDMLFKQYRPE